MENKQYDIDGPLSKESVKAAWQCGGFMVIAGAVIAVLYRESRGPVFLWGLVSIVLGLLFFLMFRRTRLVLDEEGTLVRHIFGGTALLPWREVRTAAITRLNGNRFILLSSREPQEVFDGAKQPHHVPGECHLIPYRTDALEAAEHYLGMKLPDFTR